MRAFAISMLVIIILLLWTAMAHAGEYDMRDANLDAEASEARMQETEMRDKKEAYTALGYKFKLNLEHKLLENW